MNAAGGALALFCLALPVSIAGTNIAAGLLTALLLRGALRAEMAPWEKLKSPALYALLAYCAAAALSALLGVDPGNSLGALLKDLHKVWILSLFLVFLSLMPSPSVSKPLAAAFGAMAFLGLYQVATERTGDTAWVRAHGFVHPVTYGEQMTLAFLGGLCFLGSREGAKGKALGWGFLGLIGLALVLNQTRGAFLGLAAGFAALCRLERSFRPWALRAAGTALGVLIFWELMPTGGRSLHELAQKPELWYAGGQLNPYLARYSLWKAALEIFRDHPWAGVGPGNYRMVFADYFQGSIDNESVWGSAHNLYLHHLAERGLLGMTGLALALGVLTATAWKRARQKPNPWNLWAASALVAFLVMNLTEVAFQNEQVTTLVLFLWAWAEANRSAPAWQKL